ncbi:tctex1 domain-containing protein 4 isoform X1 [Canis lupus familiaris]|nr:dynein light chain Tctex-type 4 [Canis lupus dingo]XP_038307809.1 tctex1 domain-containing protein 4 isoform X1 [Canis lupus familiaris]XP_038307810.1 tctex1 domain-containing protein 4 isoform X1 [Canis lupus familiaris]XP_038307811.1 tctex1 domain-containing protein 4 isoform X1 [Canis lupus familiaris]
MEYKDGQFRPSCPGAGLPADRSMAGRSAPPGRQEADTPKDPGPKLPAARPAGHLPSIDEARLAGPGPSSRRGSVLGPASSFSRRNSLAGPGAGPGGRRPSLGPVPPLGSRVSFSGLPLAPLRRAAPSYRTEPAPGERWEAARVQRSLEAALAARLRSTCYSGAEAGPLTRELCELLRVRLRELCPPRYKLVCGVVLGPRAGQGVHVASRALWDAESDGLASATFTNASLFAVAMVHGLYCE